MSCEEIKRLEDIVPLQKDEKIIDQQVTRLTAPGENYGSLMLKVNVTIEGPIGTREIKAVAKTIPPNVFIQKVFNTQVTFRNEIAFYRRIVPALQDFQRENGFDQVIECFPKHIGSRINLNDGSDAQVDSDAVLMLENLQAEGFSTLERTEGFDLDAAILIIKDLAQLHGTTIALKLKKPEVFESEVKEFLTTQDMSLDDENERVKFNNQVCKLVEGIEGCKPFVKRVGKVLEQPPDFFAPRREPFATICHNDAWVNNAMVKIYRGKPIQNKLVDFQVCDYGSPAKDVLFFLFSSVKNEVIRTHFDYLVALYHQTLTDVVKKLGCPAEEFCFRKFEQELELEAKSQFVHCVFMLFPIFAPKGTVKDISEIGSEDLASHEPTDLHKQKLKTIINEFVKRNWI